MGAVFESVPVVAQAHRVQRLETTTSTAALLRMRVIHRSSPHALPARVAQGTKFGAPRSTRGEGRFRRLLPLRGSNRGVLQLDPLCAKEEAFSALSASSRVHSRKVSERLPRPEVPTPGARLRFMNPNS